MKPLNVLIETDRPQTCFSLGGWRGGFAPLPLCLAGRRPAGSARRVAYVGACPPHKRQTVINSLDFIIYFYVRFITLYTHTISDKTLTQILIVYIHIAFMAICIYTINIWLCFVLFNYKGC